MANYYISSFFWSVVNKLVSAILNFLSVPLLLHYFGVNNYGVLSLATATNACLSMMDMGMMSGSVKYFSQWRAEGKHALLERVAGTSLSFYGLIGLVNSVVLIAIAFWGESFFNISHDEFLLLRVSLLILAFFSVFHWISAVFYQLLVSAERMSFVQQAMTVQNVVKVGLIYVAIYGGLSLNEYFFLFSFVTSSILLPYVWRCKKLDLVSSLIPKWYWKDFRIVFYYSLAIFCWSVFSMVASQSRPIVLGMFCGDAARVLADYRIIEVFPLFIISIGGMLSGILLPKASVITSGDDEERKQRFLYEGTSITTILCACLCCPIILCAKDLLTLYVGSEYVYLVPWLQLWCFSFLFWLHTTPASSVILAQGDIRPLMYSSGIACVLSILINILLCHRFEVGSAVIGYWFYLWFCIGFQYIYYYSHRLGISRKQMFLSFLRPTIPALLVTGVGYVLLMQYPLPDIEMKSFGVLRILAISGVWLVIYLGVLCVGGIMPGQLKKVFW